MQSRRFFIMAVIFFAVVLLRLGYGRHPQAHEAGPATLDEYDFAARGRMSPTRGTTPGAIARLDNNGELLVACLEPKTSDELKSKGIRFSQSQLEVLTDWDLLAYDRKTRTYKTTVHVFGPRETSAIRGLVEQGLDELETSLAPDLAALGQYLGNMGRGKSLFSILYAYVLHGYTMDRLAEEVMQKPQLSAEHPFWNGYSWAVYPVRKFNVGPLYLTAEGTRFYILGGEGVPGPGFREWLPFTKDVAIDRRIDDPELRNAFSAFGIADEEGKLTVPVFEGGWSERLENMARSAYARTAEIAASEEMRKILGMETRAQTEMFVHYEVRTAFLERLMKKGAVAAPVDFEDPQKNGPADAGHRLFLIVPSGQQK